MYPRIINPVNVHLMRDADPVPIEDKSLHISASPDFDLEKAKKIKEEVDSDNSLNSFPALKLATILCLYNSPDEARERESPI